MVRALVRIAKFKQFYVFLRIIEINHEKQEDTRVSVYSKFVLN